MTTKTKGIVLAGGSGTRLHPLTLAISKQLLPVYDKPMVYYSIATLMMAGIREILVISTPHDMPQYQRLLGDGSQWGVDFSYVVQDSPDGLAQAFLLGEDFIGADNASLILGDNIFYGQGLGETLKRVAARQTGATVFGYRVRDPERYGVAEFDSQGMVIGLEEKPATPRSNFAVTGLYFYDNRVVDFAKSLEPSARGELEITDLNKIYLEAGELKLEKLGRGSAWLDTGTHDSLLEAGAFIETLEKRQGLRICCPEEIAYAQNWISTEALLNQARALGKSGYGAYLANLPNIYG